MNAPATPQEPPGDTIATLAMWLARHTDRLRQNPAAPDAYDEITRAVTQAHRAIDRPPQRTYAGPCPNPHCRADIYGWPGQAVVTCRQCGQPAVVTEQHEAMRQALEDHLGNASYVAKVATGLGLPLTEERVRKWVERGKLVRHGGLLRVGDVIDLALDMRAKLAHRGLGVSQCRVVHRRRVRRPAPKRATVMYGASDAR